MARNILENFTRPIGEGLKGLGRILDKVFDNETAVENAQAGLLAQRRAEVLGESLAARMAAYEVGTVAVGGMQPKVTGGVPRPIGTHNQPRLVEVRERELVSAGR